MRPASWTTVMTCQAFLLTWINALSAVASRVTRALEFTFSQPTFLETLVKQYGVCIEEVRIKLLIAVLMCLHSVY